MGELSALAAGGALSFQAGLALVRRRGELMKEAGEFAPGAMAAVLGLDIPTLERICDQASQGDEIVQLANDNCPGQVVISGAHAALARAIPLAEGAGARRVIPLAVSIAAHTPLMKHAQAAFNQAVDATPINEPTIPLIGNVTAKPLKTIDAVRGDLKAQLTSRVRWTESIQYMASQGVTHFVEVGSGNVLCGLLRRIDRDLVGIPFREPDDLPRLDALFD
jgi:[acyl-carrier-protein] S-malonyltransferase